MSNYLVMVITVLTAMPIIFGLLLGLLRGSRRALLRLLLVVLCAVVAFVLCGMVADQIIEVDVSQFVEGAEGPMTLGDFVAQMLGEQLSGLSDIIVPIAQSLVKVISFLLLFGLLSFVTWLIVFPILKIFIKPKQVRDSHGRVKKKKRALLGAVFGIVQGLVVALVVCIVFNGFFSIADDVLDISDGITEISQSMGGSETVAYADEGESGDDEFIPGEGESGDDEFIPGEGDGNDVEGEGDEGNGNGEDVGDVGGSGDLLGDLDVKALLAEYRQSQLGQLYGKIGAKPFAMLTQIKTADDRTITLTGQLDGLKGVVNIAKEFLNFTKIDMEHIYEEDSIVQVKAILTNIQNIRAGMTAEGKETVDKLMTTLSDAMGINLNVLAKIDEINVEAEGKALETLGRLAQEDWSTKTEEELKEDAKELIKDLGNSELLMDVLDELLGDADLDIVGAVGEDMAEQIENVFDELVTDGTLSQEKVDKLRDLLGFNKQSGDSGSENGGGGSEEGPEIPDSGSEEDVEIPEVEHEYIYVG